MAKKISTKNDDALKAVSGRSAETKTTKRVPSKAASSTEIDPHQWQPMTVTFRSNRLEPGFDDQSAMEQLTSLISSSISLNSHYLVQHCWSQEVIAIPLEVIPQSQAFQSGVLELLACDRSHHTRPVYALHEAAVVEAKRKLSTQARTSPATLVPIWSDDQSDVVVHPLLASDVPYFKMLYDRMRISSCQLRFPSKKWHPGGGNPVATDYLHYIWSKKFMTSLKRESARNLESDETLSLQAESLKNALRADAVELLHELKIGGVTIPWLTSFIHLRPMTINMFRQFLSYNRIQYTMCETYV